MHAHEVSLHLEPKSKSGESSYKITILNKNNSSDKIEFTVKFNVTSTSTVINSAEEKGINIYPNPVADNLTLEGEINNPESKPLMFKLYSIEGRLVKHIQLNGYINYMNTTINCSDIPAGIYSYTISVSGIVYSGRIVKQ